jgi:hypothetical protein
MLTPDIIQQLGVKDDQVKDLNTFIETAKLTPEVEKVLHTGLLNLTAELKKTYDGKANENAENIISGAAKKLTDVTGVQREQGEKYADFLVRASAKHMEAKEAKLTARQAEPEEKIKNGNVSETVKKELEETKVKLQDLLKKEAEYEKIKPIAEKYPELEKSFNTMKITNAFGSVKPSFPDTVNQYEASAKWNAFVAGVQAKHNIEIVDGEAIAIDKENQYKPFKLSELVGKDETIQALIKGRVQTGPGFKKPEVKIEGIPFAVPENATSEEKQKAIREYLLNELKIPLHDPRYAVEFGRWNVEISKKQQKTA